jgi:hypothetical protein
VPSLAATRTQHAVRILAILRACGEQAAGNDPHGVAQAIRSELRLQALDFWLRNPDYLADEILNLVETGRLGETYLQVAESLLADPEPALHRYPMPKWFYGAYEAVDDAVALLEAYGLALTRRRGAPPKRLQSQFFLTELGAHAADEMARTEMLDWYGRQAGLVHLVAADDPGNRLKDRQYAQETYAGAARGDEISPVADRVRRRLAAGVTAFQAENGKSAGAGSGPDGQTIGTAGLQMELWQPSVTRRQP